MIVQLPEWDGWRVSGEGMDWQIQVQIRKGKKAGQWEATNSFPTLDSAIGFAYERTLRKNGLVTDDLREAEGECRKLKDSLLKAVRKAVADSERE